MSTGDKTVYDRNFLLELEHTADAKQKPADLPDLSEIMSKQSQVPDKAVVNVEDCKDIKSDEPVTKLSGIMLESEVDRQTDRKELDKRGDVHKISDAAAIGAEMQTTEQETSCDNLQKRKQKRPNSGKSGASKRSQGKDNDQTNSSKKHFVNEAGETCHNDKKGSYNRERKQKSDRPYSGQDRGYCRSKNKGNDQSPASGRTSDNARPGQSHQERPSSGHHDRRNSPSLNEFSGDQRNYTPRQQQRQQQNTTNKRQETADKTPRGQGRNRNQRGKAPATPKQIYESYWSLEDLSNGLKSGQLIQGPLRINPKNYEECYIPHPDGVSDIFISGIRDRNRAMNGDIVAVMVHDREHWRVDVENLGHYEAGAQKSSSNQSKTGNSEVKSRDVPDQVIKSREASNESGSKKEIESTEVKVKGNNCEGSFNVQNPDLAEDSDPDVVIESEEEVDLVTGQSVKLNTKCSEGDGKLRTSENLPNNDTYSESGSRESCAISTTQAADKRNISKASHRTTNTENVNNEAITDTITSITDSISNVTIASCYKNLSSANTDTSVVQDKTVVKPDSSQSEIAENNKSSQNKKKGKDQSKNKGSEKGNNSSKKTPQKKYTSLQDVLHESSPVVKNLFANDKKEDSQTRDNPDKYLQRTAKVVAIIEPKHSRACTGNIKLMQDKNPNKALFVPIDARVPRLIIPMSDCPPKFLERPEDHANTLFIARIIDWPETSMMAHGELKRSLGEAGEIEPETEGILIENDVDFSEFTEEALSCLPVQVLPWVIPQNEYTYRRDFRDECIFTIDPTTARDLDDALSCEKLEDGTYEVGVHIADVSYFLKEGTVLDRIAGSRATSVYLVQKVIPMLPRILCEQLCSLNPNEDRLTFSVVWKMSESGEIYEEWFGRSVINSCVKLSYDHAQGFIEQPNKEWTTEELPPIARFSINEIKKRVLDLHKIAVCLRKFRFDGGALRLDQVKLQYTLDPATGLPNGYNIYQQRDSNRLVEEFMLLANMAVARKIKSTYPSKALLRRHPPPQSKMVDELSVLCENLGVPIDMSSAGNLQRSLWSYCGDDEYSTARMQVLVSMCSKPMQNAKYFCTGSIDDEELYHHYALNVPLYTHFTSPIRRYADVIVHRLLAAALGYCEEPRNNVTDIQKQAEQCNDKKTNSKRVQDLSLELFFAVFVKTAGPFEEKAMVMGVLDKSFDVYVLKLGVVKRVYCDKLEIKDKLYVKEQKKPVLTLIWAANEKHKTEVRQTITIFTVVDCVLQAGDRPLSWMATIKHPADKDIS